MSILRTHAWIWSIGLLIIALSFFAWQQVFATTTYPAGSLITCGKARAVYYVANNGKRYVFPNKQTYLSWYPTDKRFTRVQSTTVDQCRQMAFGGNVTKRPGVYLLKTKYDPEVYAVDGSNTLRHVTDAAILRTWYPSPRANRPDRGWEKVLRNEPEQFWNDYVIGEPIRSANAFNPVQAREAKQTIESILSNTPPVPPTTPPDPPKPPSVDPPQPPPVDPPEPPTPHGGIEIGGRNPVPPAPENGGNFRTFCHTSHFNYDDPLVFPGQPGASHLHMYFGNRGVNAFTTADSLVSTGDSTCNGGTLNRTGYWVPAMLDTAGNPQVPLPINVYYKNGVLQPEDVQPMPNGLRMIAGDASSGPTNQQSRRVAQYSCLSTYTTQVNHIPNCDQGDTLIVQLSFPQCWDGVNLDSPDHKSHLAYGEWNGVRHVCPSTHPVGLSQLTYVFDYPVNDPNGTKNWRISSDMYDVNADAGRYGGHSMHGDWMMAWDETVVQTWTRECINARRDCSNGELGDGTQLVGLPAPTVTVPGPVPPHGGSGSGHTHAPTPEPAPAPEPEPKPAPTPPSSTGEIVVTADGSYITWTIGDGLGQQGGTMMVFGLSPNPEHKVGQTTAYYRPYQSANENAWVNDVYGAGTYHVRVCSYNEQTDVCTEYSNEVTVTL